MLSKLIVRVLKKLKILPHINFTVRYPHDSKIVVPIRNGIGYDFLFPSEEWLDNLLKKILYSEFAEGYFIDIGVNIGQTLIKVKSVKPTQAYIGFEPNPYCLAYVNDLIILNKFSAVRIIPLAISTKAGVLNLNLSSAIDSSATIITNFRSKKTTPLLIASADKQVIDEILVEKIGVIKIDVEGSELEVIETLTGVIARQRPLIICEILPVYSRENLLRLERQQKIQILLDSMSYRISLIHEDLTLTELTEIGVHSDLSRTNYIFYPSEAKGNIDMIFTTAK